MDEREANRWTMMQGGAALKAPLAAPNRIPTGWDAKLHTRRVETT